MPEFRSQSEAARQLDLPEATLRSWIRKFRAYVISHTGEYGKPVYDMDRLRELHYICNVWARTPPRRSLDEVARELARRYPVESTAAGITPPPEPDFETLGSAAKPAEAITVEAQAVTVDPQSEAILASLPVMLEKLTEAFTSVEPLLNRQVELAEQAAVAAAESTNLQRAILAYLEHQHQQKNEPWFRWVDPFFLWTYVWTRLNPTPVTDDHDDEGESPRPSAIPLQLVAPREGL